jgi:acyl dehydratase
MPTTIGSLDELKTRTGEVLGSSGWREITQEQVNQFADATGDHQWIHIDPVPADPSPTATSPCR